MWIVDTYKVINSKTMVIEKDSYSASRWISNPHWCKFDSSDTSTMSIETWRQSSHDVPPSYIPCSVSHNLQPFINYSENFKLYTFIKKH